MKIININSQQVMLSEQINPSDVIKNVYPSIKSSYFMEAPNIYDRHYISGEIRAQAIFTEGYTNKKITLSNEMKSIYSNCLTDFSSISRDEANTPEGSWSTVISGKRPMGQFSVDSLYSPVLHALLELPNIACKIFPKENNDFLYIIVLYRMDCKEGEKYANDFIELYNKKRKIMDDMVNESHKLKIIKSELAITRDMGQIFMYHEEEIKHYMDNLNLSFSQLVATSPNYDTPH